MSEAAHPTETQFPSSIRPDGKRVAVQPADVKGRFITRRRLVWAALIAFYVGLPLVKIGDHPAVHLDVAARRFYLFGGTFNAQDFWIVVFLLVAIGAALIFATAWLGRVWCGWACPQTVFLDGLYRPIERWIEGPRERRIRSSAGPWTVERALRSLAKHSAFLFVSYLLSHVALGLFLSVNDLIAMVVDGPLAHPAPFTWAVAVTALLYFNFAWFREQLCVVVCPYGRLQSAMQDRDSLIVGYDVRRGEPRGKLTKKTSPTPPFQLPVVQHVPPLVATVRAATDVSLATAAPPAGDCIDCKRCVVVCPTGIDIRNGLQMECIACAQCIDACDEVMIKVGRAPGLIRYDSLNGLNAEPKRVVRPRLMAYGGVLAAASAALVIALVGRTPFEANLLRMRGVPYVLDGEVVRNQFELHLVNKHPESSTFLVRAQAGEEGKVIVAQPEVTLGSLESLRIPIFVTFDRAAAHDVEALELEVEDVSGRETKKLEARILAPKS